MTYEPLKITFHMETPICLTYPWIHFDALLTHLKNREVMGNDYRALPSKRLIEEIGERPIPVKRTAGIYHASVSFFDSKDAFTTTIYKRFCEKYLDLEKMKRRKIQRGSGHFRDFMMNLVYIPATEVYFYCCGDADEIESLLDGLPGLGKKTAIGFGFVKDFEIRRIREDRSIIGGKTAMRPIPISALGYASDTVIMAYRPPYWAKEYTAPCAPPGAEVRPHIPF